MRDVRIHSATPLQANSTLQLETTAARHVSQVLRMRVGAELVLFDGLGGEYPAVIECTERNRVVVATGAHRSLERESPLHITLWHGLCRGARMDTVVQKATELGAARIQPMLSDRSVVKLDDKRARKKLEHWQKVAVSACEQSGRNRIPEVRMPQSFTQLLATATDVDCRLLLHPVGSESLAHALLGKSPADTRILLCTGPEGGFTEAETEAAIAAGMRIVTAGPRVLRTETAPLAALSIAQCLAGDFKN